MALWDTPPKNVFVASFIGTPPPMNLMPGTPVDGGIRIGKHVLAMPPRETVERITDDEVTVGIRPDNLVITDSPEDAEFHVEKVELPGSDAYLYGTIDGAGPEVCARVQTRRPPQAGGTGPPGRGRGSDSPVQHAHRGPDLLIRRAGVPD